MGTSTGTTAPLRLIKLSSGNTAVLNTSTHEAIVLEPSVSSGFSLGPGAWAAAQQLVSQNQAVMLAPVDVANLEKQMRATPMLSGSTGLPS